MCKNAKFGENFLKDADSDPWTGHQVLYTCKLRKWVILTSSSYQSLEDWELARV
jgi:hypothetical protein